MPKARIVCQLPNGTEYETDLHFLKDQSKAGEMYYLQLVRSAPERADRWRNAYQQMESIWATMLTQQSQLEFDCILTPPSRFGYGETYKNAFL